jgi:peptide/nickel transport system substrate-binding protein
MSFIPGRMPGDSGDETTIEEPPSPVTRRMRSRRRPERAPSESDVPYDDESPRVTRLRSGSAARVIRVIRAASLGGAGLAGAALIACSAGESATPVRSGGSTTASGLSPASASAAPSSSAVAASEPAPKPGGILRLSQPTDADTLDTIAAAASTSAVFTGNIYDRLFRFTVGDRKPAPGTVEGNIAETWEQPDPLTYVLHLRRNAKWDSRAPTSGRLLTSADVVQSWDKFAKTSVQRSDLVNSVEPTAPVISVEAVDTSTVRMKLAFVDAQLLPILAWGLNFFVHPIESMNGGFDPAKDARGTGPYMLTGHKPAVSATYQKNPNWWGGPDRPYIDQIIISIIHDAAQSEAQFRAKNLHLGGGGVPAQDLAGVAQDLKGTELFITPPSASTNSFGLHRQGGSPFDDPRVRQAVSMSLDRDAFIDVIYDPKSLESIGLHLKRYWNTPISAGYGAQWLDPKGPSFGPSAKYLLRNVAEAKKLLQAAGYTDSKPLAIDLIYPTILPHPQYAEVWFGMMKEAGIDVHRAPLDYTTKWLPNYLRAKGNYPGPNGHPGMIERVFGGSPDAGFFFSRALASGGSQQIVGDKYPELDAMIAKQLSILDEQERNKALQDIQRYVIDQMVVIPIAPSVDPADIKWRGLHGPERWFAFSGGISAAPIAETQYLWWLDDTLRS